VLLLLVSGLACSEAEKRKWRPRTAEQNYRTALEAENADLRRDAVARIGESSYRESDDAYHVLDAVARTDPATQVRCVAITVLGRYQDERPAESLLKILTADGPKAEALPADDDVRWEAARALADLHARGLLNAEQENAACELFIGFLAPEQNRNVRIVSTEALGGFKDRRVLIPLINALRSEDFMIADTAERSLMALTGRSHQYDAEAWTDWLAQTADPFAEAGRAVSGRPTGPNWWDRQQRLWRKTLKLGGTN